MREEPRPVLPRGVAALLLAGLAAGPAAAIGQGQQAGAPTQAAPEAQPGGYIDRILVKVNGEPILQSELEEAFEERMAILRAQFPPEQLETMREQLRLAELGGMIESMMLQQRADEVGLDATPNDVDRAIARLMEQNGFTSDEQFDQALAAQGLTRAMIREQMRKTIVEQRLIMEEVQRGLFVSAREVRDYYEANQEQFRSPARVLFRQIIFPLQGADPAAVEQRAAAALAELRGGLSMSAVAGKYEGAQLFGGEETSWISLEDLQPELAGVIEGMSVNSYSEPVVTRFAIHVLQLLDRQEEVIPQLEEVERDVEAIIAQQKQEQRMATYMSDLRRRSYLEVLAPEYAAIEEQWADAPGTTDPSNQRR